ncbi:hypothetical protein ACQJBY_049150 [Aegilops geniculata]
MSQDREHLYDKGKQVVEYERTPRSQLTNTHRPPSGFFIREQTGTTNYSVSSSDDDDNVPTQLPMMIPIAGNLKAFEPVPHVETSIGIALTHDFFSVCIYTFVKQNGSSGNHSREGTYYDHHASLRGTDRSIDHNIGSDIALGLDTEDTVPEHIASNDIIKSDRKQKRRDQYMARRNRLTPEQMEEINARRREARKKNRGGEDCPSKRSQATNDTRGEATK